MRNTNKIWENVFLGFAIVTVISGIYLIFQKDYIIGLGGMTTGLLLIYLQKMNTTKEDNSK